MSTHYKHFDTVPSGVLAKRLDELSDAMGKVGEERDRELTRRIPAELDRDADLVLSQAAKRLRDLEAERDALAAPAVRGDPVAWVTADTVDGQTVNGKPRRIWWENNEGVGIPIYAAPQPAEQRCEYCDGTGDVHSIDGEWRGTCSCPAGRQPAPDVAALVEALELAIEYWRDRQQRYKNRKPRWVADAGAALDALAQARGEV